MGSGNSDDLNAGGDSFVLLVFPSTELSAAFGILAKTVWD